MNNKIYVYVKLYGGDCSKPEFYFEDAGEVINWLKKSRYSVFAGGTEDSPGLILDELESVGTVYLYTPNSEDDYCHGYFKVLNKGKW